MEKNKNNYPQGHLRVSRNPQGAAYYFINEPAQKTGGRYIKKSEIELAKNLAQKEYEQQILEWARDLESKLDKVINEYKGDNAGIIYDSLCDGRKLLINPIEISNEEYVRIWENEAYESKEIRDDIPYFVTDKGEKVRSKSEKILADKFFKLGIPYKYECPLRVKGYGIIYPDFTLLNAKTRQIYYWEHLGMMDSPEYVEKAVAKINTYQKSGIFPGKELLLSFEYGNKLDMGAVDALLQECF
ncbi:MAG: hypothetical protein HUJ70_00540 [Pseudobutyrivibrio sp.]|nr:hypothetical protein [Pseudobutyrivibrio sp.]